MVGSSNTQINHYTVPSAPPGGTGRWARIAMWAVAAVLVGGVITFAVITFVLDSEQKPEPLSARAGQESVKIAPAGVDDLCVDIEESRDEPGTTVQLWECGDDNLAQKWKLGGHRRIESAAQCLAAKNGETAIGTPVVLEECSSDGSDESQQWEWLTSQWTGERKLHNILSDRCLGYVPQGEKTDRDAPLAIYDCDSEFAREWTFR